MLYKIEHQHLYLNLYIIYIHDLAKYYFSVKGPQGNNP